MSKLDKKCIDCGSTPKTITSWEGKWRCPPCDEVRRRKEISATGTVIDDQGVVCEGCLFGIREIDMCVVDPDGDGPYHYNCGVANFGKERVRLAPDEFAIIMAKAFKERGKRIRSN